MYYKGLFRSDEFVWFSYNTVDLSPFILKWDIQHNMNNFLLQLEWINHKMTKVGGLFQLLLNGLL